MLDPFTPSFYRRLQHLKIQARKAYLGTRQGTHLSLRKGHGLEFSDYRHYSLGDDFRHIDWNVLARTDHLYVREFREEQEINVIFLVDASNSMKYPIGEGKFELAKYLALALGYVALTDGDTVTFGMLGQHVTPAFVGAPSLSIARSELNKIDAQGTVNIEKEIRAAIARFRIPGKCFIISDCLSPIEEIINSINFLKTKSFDVVVLQVLAPSELNFRGYDNHSYFVDSETGEGIELDIGLTSNVEYAKLLAQHVDELQRFCRGSGVPCVLLSSAESVSDIVLTKLPELGLLK